MADQAAPEVEKKGFFSRKKKAPAPLPAMPATPVTKPLQVRPAPPPGRTGAQRPVAPQAEPRVSLELMPQVEKRIDRMQVSQRRAALLERYERKYGEKLEVPKQFVPLEEEAASMAPPDAAKLEQVVGPAPVPAMPAAPRPAAPAATVSLPPKALKPPVPAPAATARPALAPAPRPAVPKPAAKPAVPGIAVKYNAKSFWKYLWNPARLPMRAIAKLKYPGDKGKLRVYTAADAAIWIVLFIPRFLVLLWLGLIGTGIMKVLNKRKGAKAGEEATVVSAVD